MKTKTTGVVLGLIGMIFSAGGCQEKSMSKSDGIDQSQINQKIVDTYSDLAIQNAIIAQHTLYPYHFVNNSNALNGVGKRDLAVLIQHFQQNPGRIDIQRGAAEEALYQARKQVVYDKLIEAGIPQDKIQLSDGLPGGDGMPSNSVIEILEKCKEKPADDQKSGTQIQFYSTMGK
jgi:hypothetical protein